MKIISIAVNDSNNYDIFALTDTGDIWMGGWFRIQTSYEFRWTQKLPCLPRPLDDKES